MMNKRGFWTLGFLPLFLSSCGFTFGVSHNVSYKTFEEAKTLLQRIHDGDHSREFALPDARFLGGEIENGQLLLGETEGSMSLRLEKYGPYADGYPILSYATEGSFHDHSVRVSVSSYGMPYGAVLSLGVSWPRVSISTFVEGNRCVVRVAVPKFECLAAEFDITITREGAEMSEDEVRHKSVFLASACLGNGEAIQ